MRKEKVTGEESTGGKDIKVVSIMLGHADTRVTEQCYLVDDIQDIKMRVLAAA